MTIRIAWALYFAGLPAWTANAVAQSAPGSREPANVASDAVERVWAGMIAERAKLHSGQYLANGFVSGGSIGDASNPLFYGPCEIRAAFNRREGLERIERTEPRYFQLNAEQPIARCTLRQVYMRGVDFSLHAANGYRAKNEDAFLKTAMRSATASCVD